MRVENETITVFYAEDGTRFLDEGECRAYEERVRRLAARKEALRYFTLTHSPDLTEGRGWAGLMHIAAEVDHECVLAACFVLHGLPIDFVQGAVYVPAWTLRESTAEQYARWEDTYAQVGDYRTPATRLFISNGDPLEGFPKPVRIMDIGKKERLSAAVQVNPKNRR